MYQGRNARKAFAAIAIVAMAACAAPSQLHSDVSPTAPIALVVRNDNYLDYDVYANSEGFSHRLGTVYGESKATFSVNPSYAIPNLRIVARPIGGSRSASAMPIIAEPGDTVSMTVPALLH